MTVKRPILCLVGQRASCDDVITPSGHRQSQASNQGGLEESNERRYPGALWEM